MLVISQSTKRDWSRRPSKRWCQRWEDWFF